MTSGQAAAYNKYWASHSIPVSGVIDFKNYFLNENPIVIEIGTGMGEATWQIAKFFPEINFVGVEVHKPGLGSLVNKIEENQLRNLKLIEADALLLLQENVSDASIDAFHLYFPDPWPKVRQRKRRIVQSEFITLIHQKLKPGGYIHIATDWIEYADWIEKRFKNSDLFKGGKIDRPNFRPISKFEGQGLRKGHEVRDLKYFKK